MSAEKFNALDIVCQNSFLSVLNGVWFLFYGVFYYIKQYDNLSTRK